MHGARPARPEGGKISDTLWDLLQICWDNDPEVRRTALPIVEKVAAMYASQRPIRVLCIGRTHMIVLHIRAYCRLRS